MFEFKTIKELKPNEELLKIINQSYNKNCKSLDNIEQMF